MKEPQETPREFYKVVIIGSGFGGSVMAYRLSRAGLKVCVLERGKAYAPGEFPRSPRAVADNVWDRSRGLTGLFDFWSFDSMEAVVASGLGGGSLIYANVMLRMPPAWFQIEDSNGTTRRWPVGRAELDRHYKAVEDKLGANPYPYSAETPKTLAFLAATAAAGLEPDEQLNLAISFHADGEPPKRGMPLLPITNLHGAPRSTCVGCGECDIGCNYGSKNTTDLTYLSEAKDAGAELFTRCEALWIRPTDDGYEIDYIHHREDLDGKPLTEQELPKKTVRCRALVLAAGSLATTHLLLRNRCNLPKLSNHLGTRFSGNGDALSFVTHTRDVLDPSDGPVITAAAKARDSLEGGDGRGFFLEDGGYPQFFNWVRQTALPLGTAGRFVRFAAGQLWSHLRHHPQSEVSGELRRVLGEQRTARSLALLGMGRNRADGVMTLRDDWLAIDWSMRSSASYYRRLREAMEACADALGGRFSDNTLARLHRVVAAHPLGGCPMGFGRNDGVVDEYGRVYDYKHLVIADGSVLPSAAGANPSLTIAALADRFAEQLAEDLV